MHLSFWHLFIFSKKVCIITKKLIYIFLGKIFKKCHKLTLCLTVLRIVTELLEVARTFPGQILFLTVTVATKHSTCMCNRISWRFFETQLLTIQDLNIRLVDWRATRVSWTSSGGIANEYTPYNFLNLQHMKPWPAMKDWLNGTVYIYMYVWKSWLFIIRELFGRFVLRKSKINKFTLDIMLATCEIYTDLIV